MTARSESLHDCHIPCAVHSQEGHGICHTSHNNVHFFACNMYAIKSTRKLLTLTRVIPTLGTMHDNPSDICDWNTSQVCQYCCCGSELLPHIHDTTFYLHGWAVFMTLVTKHQKGLVVTNHLEESC